MQIDLTKLSPNPIRDFTVDPIDKESVKRLRTSIKNHKFWGGAVIAKLPNGGGYTVLAGHTRIEAAIAEGIKTADLPVLDAPPTAESMLAIYATENATQRGNTMNAAVAGTVASAIRIIAKELIEDVSRNRETSKADQVITGQLLSAKGLGEPVITAWLQEHAPAFQASEHLVREQIANLKASGDYARIIGEVEAEIEADLKEAEAEARRAAKAEEEQRERAERAKTKAAQEAAEAERKRASKTAREAEERVAKKRKSSESAKKAKKSATEANARTFDLTGVQRHLKQASHVELFRKQVTGKALKDILPVDKQAGLAEHLVKLADSGNQEITGKFIRDNILNLTMRAEHSGRKLDDAQRRQLEEADIHQRAYTLQHHFARQIQGAWVDGDKLVELDRSKPKDVTLVVSEEFRTALKRIKDLASRLDGFVSKNLRIERH